MLLSPAIKVSPAIGTLNGQGPFAGRIDTVIKVGTGTPIVAKSIGHFYASDLDVSMCHVTYSSFCIGVITDTGINIPRRDSTHNQSLQALQSTKRTEKSNHFLSSTPFGPSPPWAAAWWDLDWD
tara:strand:+ start:73 stop:444 length:372 start_codon:yes stop_codon:yes gene_type:complete